MELHGSESSLAIDRLAGTLTLARPGRPVEVLATVPDPGFGNRFARYVFPAIRRRSAGQPCDHPGLDDGFRVQLFTDAAAESARRGAWLALASG